MGGGIPGDVINNGELAFDRADAITFDGDVSGGGSLAQIGTGTIVVTGTNSARNVVTVDSAGNHSLLVAGGAATIDGATFAVDPQKGSYGRVTFYPVLYAEGGLTGTVTAAITTFTLGPWVTSTPNAVALTLTIRSCYSNRTRRLRAEHWSALRWTAFVLWRAEIWSPSRASFLPSKMRAWTGPSLGLLARYTRRQGSSPHWMAKR